jgi:ubiquinone/menaquinone biosynthesis C-methylase UbiE
MVEAKVRQQYNQLAAIYDRRWHQYVTNTLSFLKIWMDLSADETVLDVACGTGEFERLVLAEYPTQSMIGVDLSEEMLAIAQQKLHIFPNITFQTATASTLPFADHSFDVVVSANAFHYFDEPIVALQEMRRVLKQTGRLVILDWCRDFLTCKMGDIILKATDPAHRQCYTQAEFHRMLTTSGFAIARAQRVRFGWIWGLMIITASYPESESFSNL